jgi:hypothetical protein
MGNLERQVCHTFPCGRRNPKTQTGRNTCATRYNRVVRIVAVFLLIFSLAACNRGKQSNEAVRQGVVDHLNKVGLNVKGMDVNIRDVKFNGNQADATVSIAPKGNAAGGMSMNYHLEQQGGNWVVTGRGKDAGSPHGGGMMPPAAPGTENPHGGGMMAPAAPGTENPHGAMPPAAPGTENPHGAMPPASGAGAMPSPQDLPPANAGKKK